MEGKQNNCSQYIHVILTNQIKTKTSLQKFIYMEGFLIWLE